MNILIAPDKFKGSLSALEVCQAIDRAVHKYDPTIVTCLLPMADGGEGSLDVIVSYVDVRPIELYVQDPLGRPILVSYVKNDDSAFIQMASASGLELLDHHERNPIHTSTFGTGQMILDALKRGIKKVYLFVGGSATSDMGIGMAVALGYKFLDKIGNEVVPVGGNLSKIRSIQKSPLKVDCTGIEFYAVCDVLNPLFGPLGAAHVYAGQKGASKDEILQLDQGLIDLSNLCALQLNKDIARVAGSGAAGGMGAGVLAFLNGQIISGTDMILKLSEFEKHLSIADLVITGEGKIDKQTLQGKLIAGIAARAKIKGVPVWVIAGISELHDSDIIELNIDRIESIIDSCADLNDAITNAAQYISEITVRMLDQYLEELGKLNVD